MVEISGFWTKFARVEGGGAGSARKEHVIDGWSIRCCCGCMIKELSL
jgi:hypothetical protein